MPDDAPRFPLSFTADMPGDASDKAAAFPWERQVCGPAAFLRVRTTAENRHGSCVPQRNNEDGTTKAAFAPQDADSKRR